jgi:hypothetical protein
LPSARTARRDIAAAIDAAKIEDVTVYSEPPDQMQSPAVFIGPGNPYREPSAICTEVMNLRLVVVMPRSAGHQSLDGMDDLIDSVRAAIRGLPWLTWTAVDQVGVGANIGGTDHLLGSISARAELNY